VDARSGRGVRPRLGGVVIVGGTNWVDVPLGRLLPDQYAIDPSKDGPRRRGVGQKGRVKRVRSRPTWWPVRSGVARSRLTWPSSRPTSRGARARCYLSVKPRGTRVMGTGHLERLRRARDLLAVKGYDTEQTR